MNNFPIKPEEHGNLPLPPARAAKPAKKAIPYIYAEVFLITAGSLIDLLIFGP